MSELAPQKSPNDQNESELEDEELAQMGLLDHMEELRWTLLKPLAVFAASFLLVMIFITDVKDLLMWPLFQSLDEADRKAFDGLATRNPMGVYTAMLHIGLIVGVAVASPFFVYYGGRFLAPALKPKEKRLLIPGALGVLVLFLLGCSFSFFLLLPKAIDVTIWFNALMGFQLIWSPDSYFSFITWIVLGMGMAFQFPLVILLMVYFGVVTTQKLRELRRVMVMVFIVGSAILTPPDPITQIMMATPMWLLYEISIWIAAMVERKRAREEEV